MSSPEENPTLARKSEDEILDRRRKQTRMAQRAYRNRKQQNFVKLEQEISELRKIISTMHVAFFELYDDLLLEPGISTFQTDRIVRRINVTAGKLNAMSASAGVNLPQVQERGKIAGICPEETHRVQHRALEDRASRHGLTACPPRSPRPSDTTRILDLEFPPPIFEAASKLQMNSAERIAVHAFQTHASTHQHAPVERPIAKDQAYTYSFQESTFARRIQRVCLEFAFHNLSNPGCDPDFLAYAFRWSFTFSDRRTMTQRCQELLKRKAGESLENWSLPYFSVGGAATHFAHVNEDGVQILLPNLITPMESMRVQDNDASYQKGLSSTATAAAASHTSAYDGDWYDAFEVDCYLRSMGIHLAPTSSYVSLFTPSAGNPTSNFDMRGGPFDFHEPEYQHVHSTISESTTAQFLFDVDDFLKTILRGGACFGRAPGFRKRSVDEALRGALQRVY